jgi:hypothetical protein
VQDRGKKTWHWVVLCSVVWFSKCRVTA